MQFEMWGFGFDGDVARDHTQEGRFTAAGGSEDGEKFPGGDGEIHALDAGGAPANTRRTAESESATPEGAIFI